MRNHKSYLFLALVLFLSFFFFSCQKTDEGQVEQTHAEISEEETTASVPALSDLHEVVYPLWHTAFPEKDYTLIKELLPQADSLTEKLDSAELPGILRDKSEQWAEGKAALKTSLANLHKAVEENNNEEMLNQLEAFHSAYERLVRTIRPVVSELEAFHQELYKLYHYHMPNYELEEIRTAVAAMLEKLEPLKTAELPTRLASRQEDFLAAVANLEIEVNKLAEAVKTARKQDISEAVEKVHTAYQETEKIFD